MYDLCLFLNPLIFSVPVLCVLSLSLLPSLWLYGSGFGYHDTRPTSGVNPDFACPYNGVGGEDKALHSGGILIWLLQVNRHHFCPVILAGYAAIRSLTRRNYFLFNFKGNAKLSLLTFLIHVPGVIVHYSSVQLILKKIQFDFTKKAKNNDKRS